MARSTPNFLRSLRHQNLRLFFAGQGLSLIGTWITTIASSWLVYRLTDSEFLLGLVMFSGQIPTALLSPVAGVLADRWDRRKVLLWTQSLSMLQSFALAFLSFSGLISVPQIIILNIFQAMVNAFDIPARQALLPALVEELSDLPNAIALQAAMFHGARLIGPAIAGLLINLSGEAVCFLIDGVSYAAVIVSLLRLQTVSAAKKQVSIRGALVDGVRYAFHHDFIRTLLVVVSLFALLGTPQITLLPVFAKDIFQGDAQTYGLLMASSGVGALFGAFFLASRKLHSSLPRIVSPMPLLSGGVLIVFASSDSVYLAAAALLVAGCSMVVLLAGCNSMIQLRVDDAMRGRVLSFYALAFTGMMSLGGLMAGSIAHSIGARATVTLGGIFSIGIGIFFFQRLRKLAAELPPPEVRSVENS